jgi:hypothetical protein
MPKGSSTSATVAASRIGTPIAHSHGWDAALDKALGQAAKDLGTGDYRIDVQFWGNAHVTNPGQILSYGVTITRQS